MNIRNHRHIGCYGILIKDDKIVLIRKSRGAYTGKLDLPGGSFEHGETPEECVTREMLEETGLVVSDLELIDVISINFEWECIELDDIENLHHIGIFYKVNCTNQDLKTDSDGLDSLGAGWYEIKKLNVEEISPLSKYILEKLGYNL